MTNSKAYPSFVLLFAFLLSCHVLTHELPDGIKHSYKGEGNNFKYPTLSQDLEKDWRRGSIDVEERIPAHNAKVHELEGSTSGSIGYHPNDFQWTFPPFPTALNPSPILPPPPIALPTSPIYLVPPFPPAPNPIPTPPPYPLIPPPRSPIYLVPPFPPAPNPIPTPPPYPLIPPPRSPIYLVPPFPPAPNPIPTPPPYHVPPPASLPLVTSSRPRVDLVDYDSTSFQRTCLSVQPKAERGPMYTTHSIDYYPGDYQPPIPLLLPPTNRDHYAHSVGYHPNHFQGTFPLVSPKAERDHYTHSVGYQSSGLEDLELENCEDGSVMRHRKMMRPSEIDWSSFHVFPAKISTMTHGGKIGDGDIGEETMN